MNSDDTLILRAQFELALTDCKQLYLRAARHCIEHHPHLLPDAPQEFLQLMGDLHKGLLIKIYVTVTEADQRWSAAERQFAESLFAHIWNKELRGQELRTAAGKVFEDSRSLQWKSVMRPFVQIGPLAEFVAPLETVVMRLANLVAKADGQIRGPEKEALRDIQAQLDRVLKLRIPDGPEHHEEAQRRGTQAVQAMRADADSLQRHYHLEDSQNSTPQPTAAERLQEAMQELDGLIGLPHVKREVRTLTNFLTLQQRRREAGLPETDLSLHMVFCGNPGTGKTTVARIVGQIYGAMGILSKGHLVETDRSGLVAEYAGQTGPKTNKKIDEALDGVLFVDEAYSLVADAQEDAYGREAIQTLLKRMEDDRDRLVVILAGYPEPMDRLLRSNPGLSSRFNTKLTFTDYDPEELGRIFDFMSTANKYEVPAATRARLLLGFHWVYQSRDEHFGNGRLVRNTFEDSIRAMANRIVNITPVTNELLTVLQPADIVMDGVPAEIWAPEAIDKARFVVTCSGCGEGSAVPASYLCRRVKCNRCDRRFVAAWGRPN